MCFKLLFLIAFQIMRCACLRHSLSGSSSCVPQDTSVTLKRSKYRKMLMWMIWCQCPISIFLFSLFFQHHHSPAHVVSFFLIFYLLVLSGHFSLFWPFKKWRPVVAELMRFGAEVEKVNFKVWGWHSSVLYVSYCQQITWRPKQKKLHYSVSECVQTFVAFGSKLVLL